VKQDGSNIEYVPENLKTADMCKEAVRQKGWALRFVPEKLKTKELCLEALKQDGSNIEYVPENLKTAEMCHKAVKEKPYALQYVPKELITAEMCKEAVKQYSDALEYVPEGLREEVRRGLESWEYQPPKTRGRQDMAEISIRALTGEEIRFEFDNLRQLELNYSPHTPPRAFSNDCNFVADKINVFVTIPDHREVPKSITLKITTIGKTAEQKETVIDCDGRAAKADLGGYVVLFGSASRPYIGYKYRQKAEITLNFENRRESLICPVSRTTTFNMCFYDAYEAQRGRPSSVGSINEFPD